MHGCQIGTSCRALHADPVLCGRLFIRLPGETGMRRQSTVARFALGDFHKVPNLLKPLEANRDAGKGLGFRV
jgi:hypothetical protein